MKRFLLPLGVFAVLVLLLGVGLRRDPGEIPSPFIGRPAPSFELTALSDERRRFKPEDMRGRVWLLNVWASWCVSCRQEHEALMALSSQGVVPIVGLNYKDARDNGQRWLERHGNPYQLSAFDEDGRVGIDYGVYGVPETFVIDRQGIVRLKLVGALTTDTIQRKLLPLIKELERG